MCLSVCSERVWTWTTALELCSGGVGEPKGACAQREPGGRAILQCPSPPNRMERGSWVQIPSLGDLALHPEQGNLGKLLSCMQNPNMDTLGLWGKEPGVWDGVRAGTWAGSQAQGPAGGSGCSRGGRMKHFMKNHMKWEVRTPHPSRPTPVCCPYLLFWSFLTPGGPWLWNLQRSPSDPSKGTQFRTCRGPSTQLGAHFGKTAFGRWG